jgi:hypothetical protein
VTVKKTPAQFAESMREAWNDLVIRKSEGPLPFVVSLRVKENVFSAFLQRRHVVTSYEEVKPFATRPEAKKFIAEKRAAAGLP